MSATIGFLAIDGEADLVLDWLGKHPDVTVSVDRPDGKWFHFGRIAPLVPVENPDSKRSPVAYLVTPRRLRGVLWSAGEVGFTATPLKEQFPRLHAVSRQLTKWLQQYELVFSWRAPAACEWNYYLEGGLRNFNVDLYALPNAFAALKAGQYFVPNSVSAAELETLCAALRLRGIACEAEDPSPRVSALQRQT